MFWHEDCPADHTFSTGCALIHMELVSIPRQLQVGTHLKALQSAEAETSLRVPFKALGGPESFWSLYAIMPCHSAGHDHLRLQEGTKLAPHLMPYISMSIEGGWSLYV